MRPQKSNSSGSEVLTHQLGTLVFNGTPFRVDPPAEMVGLLDSAIDGAAERRCSVPTCVGTLNWYLEFQSRVVTRW